ncbi:MAG: rod shape-determining protein RodA [Acidimicrobiales bacterium]
MATATFRSGVFARTSNGGFSLIGLLRRIDVALAASAVALAGIGAVMVFSATRVQLAAAGENPHRYLERQLVWIAIGIVVMTVVAAIDYRRFRQFGYLIYGLVLVSLLGVFVAGTSQYGSVRWYELGPLQLQPSEFAAIGLIVAVATYCSRKQGVLELRETVGLLVLAAVPMALVFRQPDLGTTIVLGVTLAAMLVAAGIRVRYLLLLFAVVIAAFVLALHAHILKPYQVQRLGGFLHPNQGLSSYNYDGAQSKIAIASGQLSGTGLFRGPATNLAYIPNQDNDFIFSAIGEQLGFLGSAVVIGLFGLMALRMLRAAQTARDGFGRMVCAGALAFVAFSVFENIGMTIGLMPVTGIPLPFVSYGGSASFAFFATVGLVLNVEMRRGGRKVTTGASPPLSPRGRRLR